MLAACRGICRRCNLAMGRLSGPRISPTWWQRIDLDTRMNGSQLLIFKSKNKNSIALPLWRWGDSEITINTWSDCAGMATEVFGLRSLQLASNNESFIICALCREKCQKTRVCFFPWGSTSLRPWPGAGSNFQSMWLAFVTTILTACTSVRSTTNLDTCTHVFGVCHVCVHEMYVCGSGWHCIFECCSNDWNHSKAEECW